MLSQRPGLAAVLALRHGGFAPECWCPTLRGSGAKQVFQCLHVRCRGGRTIGLHLLRSMISMSRRGRKKIVQETKGMEAEEERRNGEQLLVLEENGQGLPYRFTLLV